MTKFKNFIQEKLLNSINFLRSKLPILISKRKSASSFFRNLSKRNKLIGLALIFILLAGLGFSYFYFFQGKEKAAVVKPPVDKKAEMFSLIKKAELAGSFTQKEVARLGSMEITIYNVKEGSFTSFDRDQNDKRIEKKYFAAQVKVFNDSEVVNDILSIGLEDDMGNQYAVDHAIEFYVNNMKDFGPDENVYHRTIREGYLFYSAPPETAKKLDLIFFSGATNKKIIFKIER